MFIAVRTGLEPATPGVTGRYSNQLNYRTKSSLFKELFPCKGGVFLDCGCKDTQKNYPAKFFCKNFCRFHVRKKTGEGKGCAAPSVQGMDGILRTSGRDRILTEN